MKEECLVNPGIYISLNYFWKKKEELQEAAQHYKQYKLPVNKKYILLNNRRTLECNYVPSSTCRCRL